MNKSGVPVLMYHGIVTDEKDIANPVHVSKRNFEEQMQWLSENNYRTITIDELLKFFENKQVPSKCVVLSFDDGYKSLLTNATPILQKHRFSATLFLLTGAVGKTSYTEFNSSQRTFPDKDRPLDWSELKLMESSCWDIQSHSRNHYNHTSVQPGLLENEMRSSKEEIEHHLQKKVAYFCYPYGSYNTRCLELLKTTGYLAGFSVHPGLATWNSDTRRLPRIEVNQANGLDCFKRKVETGYSGSFNKISSTIRYVLYKNTRFKDVIKRIYDRTR